jgi:hypothetical protein
MTTVLKHSGLQKQVLALYRSALRVARVKDRAAAAAAAADKTAGEADGASAFFAGSSAATVRAQFRANLDVPKSDFRLIEFLLRQGEKKVKMISDRDVKGVRVWTVRGADP